jgi:hypothetical protein
VKGLSTGESPASIRPIRVNAKLLEKSPLK